MEEPACGLSLEERPDPERCDPEGSVPEPPSGDGRCRGSGRYRGGCPARGRDGATGARAESDRGYHLLQQLLRVRHRQGGSRRQCRRPRDRAVVDRGRRPRRKSGHLFGCRAARRAEYRGTHLPVPLCRGLVDGRAVEWRRTRRRARQGGCSGERAIRRDGNRRATREHDRRAARRPRLSLCRGAAAGRGDAPAHPSGDGHLWRPDAEPERRADPPRGAVEIRVQVDQEHRAHHPDRG